MADNQPEGNSIQEGTEFLDTIQEAEPTLGGLTQKERSAAPEVLPPEEAHNPFSLHRAGTLPARHSVNEEESPIEGRRRGRTISTQRGSQQLRELSPRSQIFKRPSMSRDGSHQEGILAPMRNGQPEPSSSRARSSTNEQLHFGSSGVRPRKSTIASQSGVRARGSTVNRRPSVLVATQATTTAREIDDQSGNFTLAGPPPVEVVAVNQPYVEAGYTELNPAYDQPDNTRPVWGLAKPLPRVVRPGMVPTKSELQIQIPEQEQVQQDAANIDLEQGRIEPTLNLGRVSSQLQNVRAQRENRLVQTFSRTGQTPLSPLGRRPTFQQPLSPSSQVIIKEENGIGATRSELKTDEHPGQKPMSYFPDDASSTSTEKDQDGNLDGDWIGDEMPLKAYDLESDEVHNLHTHWSVVRLRFREPLAELLAVTVQLTLGFCSDLVVVTSSSNAGNESTTDWAWGLATMVGIYIAGGISGAHLNPAISIMLWIYRGFPLRKVPTYILAQLLGAFIAALIAFGLYQESIIAYGGADLTNSGTEAAFITYPRHDYVGKSTAFFTEFAATSILAIAVLALGDDTNAPPGAGMNAFILGLLITVLSMAFGYSTGCAMNGARDLGPRLALLAVGYKGVFNDGGYWFYGPWVGSITGAVFGAFLYDAAVFVGGESPVNYPRRRIKRAGKKWKRKWVGG